MVGSTDCGDTAVASWMRGLKGQTCPQGRKILKGGPGLAKGDPLLVDGASHIGSRLDKSGHPGALWVVALPEEPQAPCPAN